MWILPWIRQDGKKGVSRVLAFLYGEGVLWATDEEKCTEKFLVKEYLEANGLTLGINSFWSADKKIWFPEISSKTPLSDFYFQKDSPPDDALRWVQYYWTKDKLGVNQFHKNQAISDTMTVYDVLDTIFSKA